MKKSITLLVFIVLLCPALRSEDSREERYYRAVLAEGSLYRKQDLGKKLGLLRTREARSFLVKLLEEESYWNRLGAVEGLFALGDPTLGPLLVDRFFSDHMISDELAKGLKAGMALYFDAAAAKYPKLTWDNHRQKLLELIASSRYPRGQAFVKGVIEDKGSTVRDYAFRCLARYYPQGNYDYVRDRVTQRPFREPALQYIVEHGRESDLALFLEVISSRETAAHVAIAYKAVARWGSADQKKKIFLAALRERNEALAQAALITFKKTASNPIRKELLRLIRKSEEQKTRMLAGTALMEYNTRDTVPGLIRLLPEVYIPRERGGLDMLLAGLTFGISSILDDLNTGYDKSQFEETKSRITARLREITGASIGPSHREWVEWAVYNGYTIDGVNLVQYLFSGYPRIRKRAADQAISLLGYKSWREFFRDNRSFESDRELALYLAELLVKKGCVTDEEE